MFSIFCAILRVVLIESRNTEHQSGKIQELQTMLSLRGTEHEHLDSKLDAILQEMHKVVTERHDTSIEDRLNQLETAVANIAKTQEEIKAEATDFADKFQRIEEIGNNLRDTVGVVYTRWGRTVCPGNGSHVLYTGYAAGDHFTHGGGSPNMLCLPKNPEWGKYDDSKNNVGGFLYGVEYEMDNGRDKSIFGKSLNQNDAPCVVCEVQQRLEKILIPGKKSCYDGWTREYWGYLMSGHYAHSRQSDHYCVDANPESLPGGHQNNNGFLLYFVEARCGPLKCPPYVNGRELPCVVCTK